MIDAAIEQAARRLGVWPEEIWRSHEWRAPDGATVGYHTRHSGDTVLDAPTAALFLLLLGLPEVAVRCPDCKARGGRHEEKELLTPMPDDGWECTGGSWELGTRTYSRPCPTCTVDGQPLGRVQREPARLLLDAMPRECKECEGHGCLTEYDDGTRVPGPGWSSGERIDCTGCPAPGGDPAAREALAAFADQLQAHGDQRGTWVSLWLAGPEAFAQLLGEVEAALVELAKCPGMAPGEYEGLDVHVPCVGGWLDERVIFAVGRSCPKCRAVHGLRVAVNSTPYQHAMVGLRLAESWIDDYLEPERD